MSKIAIIGGGLAGLSAAVYLSEYNHQVSVYESSPKLGGRTYSFFDRDIDDVIDNGQHIMLGCYFHSLEYLKKINALDKILMQENLKATFRNAEGKEFHLEALGNFYPLNLILAILRFNAIKISARIKIILLVTKIAFINSDKLVDVSVEKWLQTEGQSEEAITSFWEILAVGMLNAEIRAASAKIFVDALKQVFLGGKDSSKIIIPKVGLSQLFIENAEQKILQNKGEIFLSTPVKKIYFENKKIKYFYAKEKKIENFDYVIFTPPPHSIEQIEIEGAENFFSTKNFNFSPIVTAHLKLTENPIKNNFYALLDSALHWAFIKNNVLTTVTSAAFRLVDNSKEALTEFFIRELEKYFPEFNRNIFDSVKIIKEKRATFIPDATLVKNRPNYITEFDNFLLAGDWTNTGLPATIEGAIKSGMTAAQNIIKR